MMYYDVLCMYVCMYVRTYVRMYVCTHACIVLDFIIRMMSIMSIMIIMFIIIILIYSKYQGKYLRILDHQIFSVDLSPGRKTTQVAARHLFDLAVNVDLANGSGEAPGRERSVGANGGFNGKTIGKWRF